MCRYFLVRCTDFQHKMPVFAGAMYQKWYNVPMAIRHDVPVMECDACGHRWLPEGKSAPLRCPSRKCRSLKWNASVKPVQATPVVVKAPAVPIPAPPVAAKPPSTFPIRVMPHCCDNCKGRDYYKMGDNYECIGCGRKYKEAELWRK
jgi:hypothetical protein